MAATMHSINDFADRMPKSYKTRANAQRALDKALARCGSDRDLSGASVIVQRSDGRHSVIIVNADSLSWFFWIGVGFGVHGIPQEGA